VDPQLIGLAISIFAGVAGVQAGIWLVDWARKVTGKP